MLVDRGLRSDTDPRRSRSFSANSQASNYSGFGISCGSGCAMSPCGLSLPVVSFQHSEADTSTRTLRVLSGKSHEGELKGAVVPPGYGEAIGPESLTVYHNDVIGTSGRDTRAKSQQHSNCRSSPAVPVYHRRTRCEGLYRALCRGPGRQHFPVRISR